jgi:hypothetical protein
MPALFPEYVAIALLPVGIVPMNQQFVTVTIPFTVELRPKITPVFFLKREALTFIVPLWEKKMPVHVEDPDIEFSVRKPYTKLTP